MTESKSKILCVDDDNDTCELLKFVFQKEDYEVVSRATAEEGLLEARNQKFGAIILDNRFAEMSGVEICQEIRRFDTHTPIIFFSGEARTKEINAALASGATDYLVKPNDFERLTETVINLIEKRTDLH